VLASDQGIPLFIKIYAFINPSSARCGVYPTCPKVKPQVSEIEKCK